jgi:hypothetical protein
MDFETLLREADPAREKEVPRCDSPVARATLSMCVTSAPGRQRRRSRALQAPVTAPRRVTGSRLVSRPFLAGGALAALGAVALAITAVLPASPASSPGARLAAWTVTKRADGTVLVTIREITNPLELERRLRANGVPATVTFFPGLNPACQAPPVGFRIPPHPGVWIVDVNPDANAGAGTVPAYPKHRRSPVVLIIRPAAIAPHTGLEFVDVNPKNRRGIVRLVIGNPVVHHNPGCDGGAYHATR